MQRVGYGLADFFISWLRIERNLNRITSEHTLTNLASELNKALENRKAELFQTPNMLAAIYLDPRVKSKLDRTEKEIAILHLRKLYTRIHQVKTNQEVGVNELVNNTLDELNEEFADHESELYPSEEVDTSTLMLSFTQYESVKHFNCKAAVMDFWAKNNNDFPLIYELACVVHAVPAGQCFEEQNFSSFSYIRSSRRTSLHAKNLRNILTVRLNRELFYRQKQQQKDNIINPK